MSFAERVTWKAGDVVITKQPLRFNPFHGEHGWFASGDGGGDAPPVHEAVDRWQGNTTDVQKVRAAADAIVTGQPVPGGLFNRHAEGDARSLIDAVQHGEASAQTLYRGMSVPNPDYHVGQEVNFSLGSFTEEQEFARVATTEVFTGHKGDPVLYELEAGAQTLNFSSIGIDHDAEHVTGGSFLVTRVEPLPPTPRWQGDTDPRGAGLRVGLRQTDVVHAAA